MDKICPRCGISSAKLRFIGSFCENCFAQSIQIDCPPSVEIEKCVKCGKILLAGEWIAFNEKKLGDFILGKCKSKAEITSARASAPPKEGGAVKLFFLIKEGPSFIDAERVLNLCFTKTMCPSCSRQTGGYYEAIIQLRGSRERIERAKKKLVRELSCKTFISKEDELKEGIDLFIGSTPAVKKALAFLGYSFTTSSTLAGLRQGKRIYRTTFAVRL